jgi:hypothetical protein
VRGRNVAAAVLQSGADSVRLSRAIGQADGIEVVLIALDAAVDFAQDDVGVDDVGRAARRVL